jgi:carbamoyl-phosphate synthase large subunit
MFPEVDPVLGPEMRSTGEVLGMADSFGIAFFKAQEAAKQFLPLKGSVLFTVNDKDNPKALEVAGELARHGFRIIATEGTHNYFTANGIKSELAYKLYQNRPNIIDRIKNKEIDLIINTPAGRQSEHDDSYIRKAAISYKIPYITTMTAALATTKGIAARLVSGGDVKSLQEYHSEIKDLGH